MPLLFVAGCVLTAPGCSSTSSTPVPPLPVLTSLQRLELCSTPGVWMNDSDAGSLALWIYNVSGETGNGIADYQP